MMAQCVRNAGTAQEKQVRIGLNVKSVVNVSPGMAHNEQGFVSVWEFEKLMMNNLLKMDRITNAEDLGSSPNSTKPTVVGSTVILGDCVEVMKGFEDNQFDLAIVDPPYGNNLSGGRSAKNGWNNKIDWDKCNKGWNLNIPDAAYFMELQRVSKNQIVWGGNYFANLLPPSECWLIWDKGQRDFSLADGEMAWTSFDKAMRIKTIHRATANQETKMHPTQKPVKLYDWILKLLAKEGDLILDTHLGSGSSRIAADKAGLDFTGIEIDKEYFDLSEKRFKQYKSQLRIEGW
jgi:site-specific DNA-methyltransferase (adenine-specific)